MGGRGLVCKFLEGSSRWGLGGLIVSVCGMYRNFWFSFLGV